MEFKKVLQLLVDEVVNKTAFPDTKEKKTFKRRFNEFAPGIIELLHELYGNREDFIERLIDIFSTATEYFVQRSLEFKKTDLLREKEPHWFQSSKISGGFCYVDLYAGTLKNLQRRIPYFQELGLNYLHIMPLFKKPKGPNDGGYAISSYREVDPAIGNLNDLKSVINSLHENNMQVALDFVFNHTASDHDWAEKAKAGDEFYQDYYFLYDDREIPDQYDKTIREIFPDEHEGGFSWFEDIQKWVWTTFHKYQWDLNYSNPFVFRQMLDELLFLSNIGVDIFRLDAVVFIWKRLGTNCENLPETHTIIRAFNALTRIACPGVIFWSEAIVHPAQVKSYFGSGKWTGKECHISYNPLLMVELWESLATGYTHLLAYSIDKWFKIPDDCAWVNYVRSQDDIGWGFADEDAKALYIDGYSHRQYLNRFYTGEEENSFSCGFPFQYNPKTGDMRISGTTASLAGLEKAIEKNDPWDIEMSIRRILLIYGIAISMGGIFLLNLGDELGQLNDYQYKHEEEKMLDSRWVHRGKFDNELFKNRKIPGKISNRIYSSISGMIQKRKNIDLFGAGFSTEILAAENKHIFCFCKKDKNTEITVIGNFTSEEQKVEISELNLQYRKIYTDLITENEIPIVSTQTLKPYQLLWLQSM